jgi:hypothetical protein
MSIFKKKKNKTLIIFYNIQHSVSHPFFLKRREREREREREGEGEEEESNTIIFARHANKRVPLRY